MRMDSFTARFDYFFIRTTYISDEDIHSKSYYFVHLTMLNLRMLK